jgi:hypothetical protein
VDTPLPGDFGITRLSGFPGIGIRFGQFLNGDGWADYEHAFIVGTQGRIYQAAPGGVNVGHLADYATAGCLFSTWDLSDEQRVGIVAAADSKLGTPYSALDYAALLAHRLHIPAPGLRGYIGSTGHMICSQYADWCYSQNKLQMFDDGRWFGYVTPGSLRRVLTGPLR